MGFDESAEAPLQAQPDADDSPSGLAATPGLTPVRSLGDYELLEEVGHGGMGVVYKARQKSLDRIVALKLLLFGAHSPPESVKRFRAEAVATAALQHPNIVAIHEVGFCEGQHFLAMDYVEGQPLSVLIRGTLLPARTAAGYVKAIAEAIHYAHERGILHRDLKPANVMIDVNDEPHITDFGLATRLTSDFGLRTSDLTMTGQVLGSPNYMPPEQATGKRGTLSRRTDVYALGAILYHALTGRPPFTGEGLADTVQQVLNVEPLPPRALNPSVPRDLETVCLKCLEKEAGKRYTTAQLLAEELGRFLEGEPVLARPVSRLAKGWRWCRRNPVPASLAAALVLVFLAGAVGVLREWRQAGLAFRKAENNLWRAYLAQARAHRWSGRPGRRFDSLAALSNAAAIHPSLELRNEAIACLALPDMQVRARLRFASPSFKSGFAFDPKYERLGVVEQDGAITLRRAVDNTELFQLKAEGRPDEAWLLFSHNGQFLAEKYIGAPTNACRVWDLSRRALAFQRPLNIRSACFAPGDQQVVVAERTGAIHFYDLRTAEELRQLTVPGVNHVCFSPDGKRVAVSRAASPGVVIVELETQRVCRSFTNSAPVGFMSWSPDGRLLACPCADRRVHLWDPNTGEQKGILEGHTGDAVAAAFDHAGDLLVSSGWDGMARLWDPRLRRLLVSLPGGWVTPGFAPDDRTLAIATDNTGASFCDVDPANESVELGDGGFSSGWLGTGQFSPDGRLLTTAGEDGVRIWDVQAKLRLVSLPLKESRSSLFLRDGSALITTGPGVHRWPILSRPPHAEFRLGPAETLSTQPVGPATLTPDGRTLFIAKQEGVGALPLDLGHPAELSRGVSQPSPPASVTVSADGKWFAAGTWQGTGVKVFEMFSGDLRQDLLVKGSADCAFSPDGQWLATGSAAEYCLWSVGSWQPVWTLAREGAGDMIGSLVFSLDGRMLALLHGRSTRIKLVATADGRELATLETGRPLCFSPDGSELATIAEDGHSVLLWDLPLIRRRLASMNLDWDLSASP